MRRAGPPAVELGTHPGAARAFHWKRLLQTKMEMGMLSSIIFSLRKAKENEKYVVGKKHPMMLKAAE